MRHIQKTLTLDLVKANLHYSVDDLDRALRKEGIDPAAMEARQSMDEWADRFSDFDETEAAEGQNLTRDSDATPTVERKELRLD